METSRKKMLISTPKPRPNPYPFGSSINTRSFSAGSGFRFGFNGKENFDQYQDYGFRIYYPELGRFLSTDPLIVYTKKYSHLSSYQFSSLKPIAAIDIDGLEAIICTEDLRNSKGFQTVLKSASCVDINSGNLYKWIRNNKQNIDIYFVSFLKSENSAIGTTEIVDNIDDFIVLTFQNKRFSSTQISDVKNSFAKGRKILIVSIDVTEIQKFDEDLNKYNKGEINKKPDYEKLLQTAETVFHEIFAHGLDYLVDGKKDNSNIEGHFLYFGQSEKYSPSTKTILTDKKYRKTNAYKAALQIKIDLKGRQKNGT